MHIKKWCLACACPETCFPLLFKRLNHRNDQNKVSIVVQADSLHLQLHVYLRTKVLHGPILLSLKCFVTCGGGILILRQISEQTVRSDLKIFYCVCFEAFQGSQHNIGPCRL